MATLARGQKVTASLTADVANAMLAREVLRRRGITIPAESCMTRVDYAVATVRGVRKFCGAKVEVWVK